MNELFELYTQVRGAIDEIDATLDSQIDSSALGKRKLTNDLIEANKDSWAPVATSLVEQISASPVEVQIGIFYGMVRELQKAFGDKLSAEVQKLVEAAPKVEVEKISDEDLAVLSKTRSELYAKVKTLIDTAQQFGMDEGMEMPKRRTGKKGKRGPRVTSLYSWSVDGVDFEKLLAVVEGYSQYEKVSDLVNAMKSAEIDLTTRPDRVEFTLPDGKILVGVLADDTEEDEEEEAAEEAE